MLAANRIIEIAKTNYIMAVIALLAIFAFLSAVLISWPALAYLASKLFVL